MSVQKTMYRIVLTCWDHKTKGPYADCAKPNFDSEELARTALRLCVKEELETLNEREMEDIDIEYPSEIDAFKADFDGDEFDAIIRLWDGDDYWPVTGYNIEKVEVLSERSWRYREEGNNHWFYVYANPKGNRFAIEIGNERLCIKHSLEAALSFIDNELCGNKNVIASSALKKRAKTDSSQEKEWSIPVSWEMCGFVKIKAKTAEEAIEIFKETADDIPLPENSYYVGGSFTLSTDNPDYIQLSN